MKIGPYEVLGELGRGGAGAVFRVLGPDGREAALKLLLHADEASFARFEREQRLLASLGEEQGFVDLLDAGRSSEGAWLVMPLALGGTLRTRLERGPLPISEVTALGIVLARALGAAHERGIVHRDVKPENVLFTEDGRALVADLGLARHFDRSAAGGSQSRSMTAHGTLKGTAGYMAPEQLEDSSRAGPPADVFALGAVLYECLAGRPAFVGEGLLDLLARRSSQGVEPLGRGDVPRWLEAVIERALARDPRERFGDGYGLARALARPARAGRRWRLPAALAAAGLLLAGAWAARERPLPPARDEPRPAKRAAPAPRAPVADGLTARQLVERAREKNRAGDKDGERALLDRAIELDPGCALAWCDRSVARGEKGDWMGSVDDATRAIELDPGSHFAYFDRAIARGRMGDDEGDVADATRAIELAPGFAPGWSTRAAARLALLDYDAAIADAAKAIKLDPELSEAWLNRGAARADKGDLDGAIPDLSRALELAPGYEAAWRNRGIARAAKGDLEGAIADYERALELEAGGPDTTRLRNLLAAARARAR